MIGIINAESAKIKTGKDGEIYMVLQVSPESRYNAKQIRDEAKRLQKKLVIRVEKYRNKRSLNQNRLMWALLEIMATAMSGRAGDVTAWDCYIAMLERYGAKYEYFYCLPEALDEFKGLFRAVKEIDRPIIGGKRMILCKCFVGSSKMDVSEMTQLIDGIFDELADMGVDAGTSRELAYLYNEWRGQNEGIQRV